MLLPELSVLFKGLCYVALAVNPLRQWLEFGARSAVAVSEGFDLLEKSVACFGVLAFL